jgi:hypothetical protein
LRWRRILNREIVPRRPRTTFSGQIILPGGGLK